MKQPVMAMSLSAEDEDYDSDSEQVSTPEPRDRRRAASPGSRGAQLPGEECTDCSCYLSPD